MYEEELEVFKGKLEEKEDQLEEVKKLLVEAQGNSRVVEGRMDQVLAELEVQRS